MFTSASESAPDPEETLANYVRRMRERLGLSQKELAERADIHLQSVGKIERGQTQRLKQKPKNGLAIALEIPVEYLDAACRKFPVTAIAILKFCPKCWTPGTPFDPTWTNARSKFCCLCGTQLCDRCIACNSRLTSHQFRFCPYCGSSYKPMMPK